LLFQAGYLTIDNIIELPFWWFKYSLRIPNKEVKSSLFNFILETHVKDSNINNKKLWLYNWLIVWDIELFISELKKLFSSLPYNNYTKNLIENYEGYYANVIFAYLQSLGYEIIWEDVTNKWRIDLTIKVEDFIYILEFKMKSNPWIKALEQIEERKYVEKYLWENKKIFLVWIEFDEKDRNICDYEFREVYL